MVGGPGEDWHDAAHWDARYLASEREVVVDPDPSVVALVSGMPGAPGRTLDLGCGEGRHAIWLAGRGWQVTAVDFSAVAIRRARSAEPEASVNWTVADVPTWLEAEAASESRPTAYDLVVLAYLRLESYDLARAVASSRRVVISSRSRTAKAARVRARAGFARPSSPCASAPVTSRSSPARSCGTREATVGAAHASPCWPDDR